MLWRTGASTGITPQIRGRIGEHAFAEKDDGIMKIRCRFIAALMKNAW